MKWSPSTCRQFRILAKLNNTEPVVIGPYEVYEDRLMGYKAAFEAFITLRDPEYSKRLQVVAKYQSQLEANLPIPKKYHTKRGTSSPISVVVVLYTAGDTRAGVQTAAFNLPNDERVRTAKGSKKVLLKNHSEAKFNKVLVPIAKRVVASTKRRRRILSLVQDALSQLRLDMKYLLFDLEATRRERDEYRQQLEEDA